MSKSTSTRSVVLPLLAGAFAVVAVLFNDVAVPSFEVNLKFHSLGWKPLFTKAPSLDDPVHPTVRILSYEPFIMHIQDFISPAERAYLLEYSSPLLSPSEITTHNGSEFSDYRTSSTAFLDLQDPIVKRVAQRAGQFQGFLQVQDIQVTSYQPGQQYKPHHDWFGDTMPYATSDRLSTFFAILESDCSACGTEFPLVPVDWSERDEQWCEFVDCSKDILTSRNVAGSAVYWRNLDHQGEGIDETLHAGLPAANGTKVGLNIWTEVDIAGGFFSRPSYMEFHGLNDVENYYEAEM